jgi:hypothetical protein
VAADHLASSAALLSDASVNASILSHSSCLLCVRAAIVAP